MSAVCDSPVLLKLKDCMAWTEITRLEYERASKRYQSDLTDAEWTLIATQLSCSPRKWAFQHVVDAILYVLRSGCQWRVLPSDLPPRSTVYHLFSKWHGDGTWISVNRALVMLARALAPSTSSRSRRPRAAVCAVTMSTRR